MFAGQRPQPLSLKRANTTKELWSEPSSPATTFSSLSWAAEKSAAELAGLLRNAHASLREKEKGKRRLLFFLLLAPYSSFL